MTTWGNGKQQRDPCGFLPFIGVQGPPVPFLTPFLVGRVPPLRLPRGSQCIQGPQKASSGMSGYRKKSSGALILTSPLEDLPYSWEAFKTAAEPIIESQMYTPEAGSWGLGLSMGFKPNMSVCVCVLCTGTPKMASGFPSTKQGHLDPQTTLKKGKLP